jgi:hypothetical protein
MRRRKIPELEVRRHAKRVPAIPLAMPGQRCVDRETQRRIAGGNRAGDEVTRHLAITIYIQLEPSRPAGSAGDRI